MRRSWIISVLCLLIPVVFSRLNYVIASDITFIDGTKIIQSKFVTAKELMFQDAKWIYSKIKFTPGTAISRTSVLVNILNEDRYDIGDSIETSGFYTKGDGGKAKYQVQGLSGTEVWQNTGYGWQLSINGEIKYGEGKKLVVIGPAVSSKQMGCKANGVSDDSVILRAMFHMDRELFINEGTHIINITPTANHNRRFFASEVKARIVKGVDGKSIIKLGSGNCDERIYRGFWVMFSYVGANGYDYIAPDTDIYWEGITIDFNPTQNPLYHYDTRYNSADVNKNTMGIGVEGGRDFTVRHCTFIGHCGGNVIRYLTNHSNTREAKVTIENNVFADIGAESGLGCHDHSTVFVHNSPLDSLPAFRCKAYVGNNTFKAAYIGAPNAFNAMEFGVDVIAEDNTIDGYWMGILPYSEDKDVVAIIRNNNILNVLNGITIWATRINYAPSLIDIPAFKHITILNNYHYAPVKKFLPMHRYYEATSIPIPAGVELYPSFARDIKTLEILNNTFDFDYEDITDVARSSNIDLRSAYSPRTQTRTTIPTFGNVIIKGNILKNASSRAIDISSYAKLENIDIADNTIENSNWMEAEEPGTQGIFIAPVINDGFSPEAHEVKILNNTFNNCSSKRLIEYFEIPSLTRKASITVKGNVERGTTKFEELGNTYTAN